MRPRKRLLVVLFLLTLRLVSVVLGLGRSGGSDGPAGAVSGRDCRIGGRGAVTGARPGRGHPEWGAVVRARQVGGVGRRAADAVSSLPRAAASAVPIPVEPRWCSSRRRPAAPGSAGRA